MPALIKKNLKEIEKRRKILPSLSRSTLTPDLEHTILFPLTLVTLGMTIKNYIESTANHGIIENSILLTIPSIILINSMYRQPDEKDRAANTSFRTCMLLNSLITGAIALIKLSA
mmetsp:Transcript_26865/g.29953  ORF Transcript_26865/g.29953 Transcript_26865/m.29953 type:complete len:115 (-) Transcript_26865:136-480(-)